MASSQLNILQCCLSWDLELVPVFCAFCKVKVRVDSSCHSGEELSISRVGLYHSPSVLSAKEERISHSSLQNCINRGSSRFLKGLYRTVIRLCRYDV